jgi:hypothetical protein
VLSSIALDSNPSSRISESSESSVLLMRRSARTSEIYHVADLHPVAYLSAERGAIILHNDKRWDQPRY